MAKKVAARSLFLIDDDAPWQLPVPYKSPTHQKKPTMVLDSPSKAKPRIYTSSVSTEFSEPSLSKNSTPNSPKNSSLWSKSPKNSRRSSVNPDNLTPNDIEFLNNMLYQMPALKSISEKVDSFEPFSLIDYQEIDDYLLQNKARQSPVARMQPFEFCEVAIESRARPVKRIIPKSVSPKSRANLLQIIDVGRESSPHRIPSAKYRSHRMLRKYSRY